MSELREKDNYNSGASEKPQLCHMCFEFFGNQSQGWLCSKCFKIKSKGSETNTQTQTQPSLPLIQDQKMEVETSTSISTITSTPVNNATMTSTTVIEETKTEEPKIEEKKKSEPNKCYKCSKRVGLLGFKCSCELTFCKLHRLPEDHECEFDFTKVARDKLAKENPTIKGSKIERF